MSFETYLRTEAMVIFRWTPEGSCEGRGILQQRDMTFQVVGGSGNHIGEPMSLAEARIFKAAIPRDRWQPRDRWHVALG